jgi:hypothetical protein
MNLGIGTLIIGALAQLQVSALEMLAVDLAAPEPPAARSYDQLTKPFAGRHLFVYRHNTKFSGKKYQPDGPARELHLALKLQGKRGINALANCSGERSARMAKSARRQLNANRLRAVGSVI